MGSFRLTEITFHLENSVSPSERSFLQTELFQEFMAVYKVVSVDRSSHGFKYLSLLGDFLADIVAWVGGDKAKQSTYRQSGLEVDHVEERMEEFMLID